MIETEAQVEDEKVELFHVHITDRTGDVHCMWIPYDDLANLMSLRPGMEGVSLNNMLIEAIVNNNSALELGHRINVCNVEVLEGC